MATEKKQSFLGGAAVLAFGIMAVKVIGAVFKIPLRNILGEGGSADFSNAYNIYATMLTISTAGLPVALSKLVSEAYARGRTRQAQRTFNLSLTVFLVLGLVSFSLMWWHPLPGPLQSHATTVPLSHPDFPSADSVQSFLETIRLSA